MHLGLGLKHYGVTLLHYNNNSLPLSVDVCNMSVHGLVKMGLGNSVVEAIGHMCRGHLFPVMKVDIRLEAEPELISSEFIMVHQMGPDPLGLAVQKRIKHRLDVES